MPTPLVVAGASMSRTDARARAHSDDDDAARRADACARAARAHATSPARVKVNLSTPDQSMPPTTRADDADAADDPAAGARARRRCRASASASLDGVELSDWFDDGDDSGGASNHWTRARATDDDVSNDDADDEFRIDLDATYHRARRVFAPPPRAEDAVAFPRTPALRTYARRKRAAFDASALGFLPGAQMDFNLRALERVDDRACASRRSAIDVSATGAPGVANVGNTCYVAAALQLLRSMPTFTADVRRAARFDRPLVRALDAFFASTADDPPSVVAIKGAVALWYPEFEGFEQHDCMEFLTATLARIECEMGAENARACPSRLNFSWRSEHRLTCESCGDVSTHDEEQCALSLALRVPDEHNVSIAELAERYFTPERGLSRRCERESCKGETCTSARSLKTLPRVLLVHLKRFTTEIVRDDVVRVGKIRTSVRVPGTLTLDAYVGVGGADEDHGDVREVARSPRARLRGVVSHLGSAVSSGHFIAHVRDDDVDHSQWSMFDDERVSSYVARNDAMDAPQNSKTPPNESTRSQPFERECYLVAYECDATNA